MHLSNKSHYFIKARVMFQYDEEIAIRENQGKCRQMMLWPLRTSSHNEMQDTEMI
jgi:hypothetical protein